VSKFGTKAIPSVGSTGLTGLNPEEIANYSKVVDRGLGQEEFKDIFNVVPVTRGEKEEWLSNLLQYQYDNALALYNHLDTIVPAGPGNLSVTKTELEKALGLVEREFVKDGKLNKTRVINAIKAMPLGEETGPIFQLPPYFNNLNVILDKIEYDASVDIASALNPRMTADDLEALTRNRGSVSSPTTMTSEQAPLLSGRSTGVLGPEDAYPPSNDLALLDMQQIGLSPIVRTDKAPAFIVADKFKGLVEANASTPRQIGELGIAGGAVATAAGLLGVDIPSALQLGAVSSVPVKLAYDAFINPLALLKNYERFQDKLINLDEKANNFANYLVARPNAQVMGATQASTQLEKEYKKPLTSGEARELYDADVKLVDSLSGTNGIPEFDKFFSDDFQLLDDTYPTLSKQAQGVIPRQVAFLARKLKELTPDPSSTDVIRGLKQREPTKAQLFQYSQYSKYVRDPDAIYTDIEEKGYVPTQALEVLTEVFPARYALLQKKILAAMSEQVTAGAVVNPKQIRIIDTLMNNKNGWTPASIAQMQGAMAPPQAGQGGPIGGAESRSVTLETTGTTLGK
jgi:hypothetical protein